jgi:hypothetical protein
VILDDYIERWFHMRIVSDPRTARWLGFRVTPIVAVQGDTRGDDGSILPFATWKLVSSEEDLYLDLSTPGGPKVSITLEIFAETYEEAKATAKAARDVLHRATGSGWGSIVFFSLLGSAVDDVAVPVDGKGVPLYSVVQTYDIRFQESF